MLNNLKHPWWKLHEVHIKYYCTQLLLKSSLSSFSISLPQQQPKQNSAMEWFFKEQRLLNTTPKFPALLFTLDCHMFTACIPIGSQSFSVTRVLFTNRWRTDSTVTIIYIKEKLMWVYSLYSTCLKSKTSVVTGYLYRLPLQPSVHKFWGVKTFKNLMLQAQSASAGVKWNVQQRLQICAGSGTSVVYHWCFTSSA